MTLATTEQPQNGNTPVRVTPINEAIDRQNVGAIQLSDGKGGLSFSNMIELMDFAKLMAVSQTAVPKHLRGNPGACMAICMHALEWKMSPFAVANKSYCVNDRLAFESAMYHAVIGRRAPIKGRIKMDFAGKGPSRTCHVWADLADGTGTVDYTSPETGTIKPKNSPLWVNDPDQQLFYFSVRSWARRHFPDVLMGIYTTDELQDGPDIQHADKRMAVAMPRALGETNQLPPVGIPDQSASDSPAATVAEPVSRSAEYEDVSEAEQMDHQQPEPPDDNDPMPPHARTSDDWINDLVLKHKPADMSQHAAKKKFHAADAPSWANLGKARQDAKFADLVTGKFFGSDV